MITRISGIHFLLLALIGTNSLAQEWQEHKFDKDGLEISFPGKPMDGELGDGIVFNKELVTDDGVFYNLMVIDLLPEELVDGEKALMDSIAEQFGETLTSRKTVKHESRNAEQFVVRADEEGVDVTTVVRVFLVEKKLIQITLACETRVLKEVGGPKFLASLKILGEASPNLRTWTDKTGKHKLEAELTGLKDGKVQLKRRRDGKQTVIAISQLSSADQLYLKEQFPIETRSEFNRIFEPNDHALGTKEGVKTDGTFFVKSKSADLLSKDFTFEILVTIAADYKENGGIALIGLGSAIGDGPYKAPVDSAFLRIHSPDRGGGEIHLSNGKSNRLIGKNAYPGTHKVQIIKTGEAVTFAIDIDNDGASSDDIETSIPELETFVSKLTDKNTHVFFGSGGVYSKPKLTLGSTAKTRPDSGKPARHTTLGGRRRFPSEFAPISQISAQRDGLRVLDRHYVRTKTGTYLEKDFEFQLLVNVAEKSDDNGGIVFFGFGEGGRDSAYNEPSNTAYVRFHPPDTGNGQVEISNGKGVKHQMGYVKNPGTHMLKITKEGTAVTFAIDVDNDGKSSDDLELTIPDIQTFSPYLHKKNSHIMFGGGGLFQQIGLESKRSQKAKSVESGRASLTGRAPFPAYLSVNAGISTNSRGVTAHQFVRTSTGDFATKDFTYEILVNVNSTNESRQKIHYIGIGEAEKDAPRLPNSAFIQFRAADDNKGSIDLADSKSKRKIGNLAANGTHLVRIQKQGDKLTFTIDQNNDGPSDDDIVAEIEDLAAAVPNLHEKNGYLFFGGAGVYQEVNLKE